MPIKTRLGSDRGYSGEAYWLSYGGRVTSCNCDDFCDSAPDGAFEGTQTTLAKAQQTGSLSRT